MAKSPSLGLNESNMSKVENWIDARIQPGMKEFSAKREAIESGLGIRLTEDEWMSLTVRYHTAGWAEADCHYYVGQPGSADGPYFRLSTTKTRN